MTRLVVAVAVGLMVGPARADAPPVRPEGGADLSDLRGAFVDPLRQCKLVDGGDRFEITVPSGQFDLSIELGQTSAPRLLWRVQGDFSAEVRVGDVPEPEGQLEHLERLRLAYHGAGLLLWQDDRNYLRLESAAYRPRKPPAARAKDRSSGKVARYVLFELRRDGKLVGGLSRPDVRLEDRPTDLRLERRGREIRAFARQGDGDWMPVGLSEADLPDALDVGLAVVNTARSGLEARFERFRLTDGRGVLPIESRPRIGPDAPPKPVHITRPQYPAEAYARKIDGTVVVELLIDSEGRVARSRVIQSVPGLDEAALACVRTWRFNPAVKNGEPVPTIAHAPVAFRLE